VREESSQPRVCCGVNRLKIDFVGMLFVRAVVVALVVTALVKLLSAIEGSAVLAPKDPLLGISFRNMMLIGAALELGTVAVCLCRPVVDGLLAIGWLSINFLIYRVGLWWIGWEKPCSCLGNLTDVLGIPSDLADDAMKSLLTFMLVSSISLLVLRWFNRGASLPEDASSCPAPSP
jgi:hypothetical protein